MPKRAKKKAKKKAKQRIASSHTGTLQHGRRERIVDNPPEPEVIIDVTGPEVIIDVSCGSPFASYQRAMMTTTTTTTTTIASLPSSPTEAVDTSATKKPSRRPERPTILGSSTTEETETVGASGPVDITKRLCDDLLVRIFAFLGDSQTPRLNFAHKLHNSISPVCKRWGALCNDNFAKIVGPLTIDFDTKDANRRCDHRSVHWICALTKQIPIGTMRFRWLDHMPLAVKLFENCDTTQIKVLDMDFVGFVHRSERQRFVVESPSYQRSRLRHDKYTRAYNVEVRRDLTTHLTANCRSVQEFSLSVPPIELLTGASMNAVLMSMHSLNTLKLVLKNYDDDDQLKPNKVGPALEDLIPRLPQLERLEIKSHPEGKVKGSLHYCAFIQSETLLHLDVSDAVHGLYMTCKCPRLESFCCRGNKGPNGTLPAFTETQFKTMSSSSFPSADYTITTETSGVTFPGMNVPDACTFTIKSFYLPGKFGAYNNILQKITNLQPPLDNA